MENNLTSTKKAVRAVITFNSNSVFHTLNMIFWIIVLAVTIYPLYLVIIASFSDPAAVNRGEVILWPIKPSLIGYQSIMKNSELLRSYLNSIFYTTAGTALSVLITMAAAYSLSRSYFPGKKLVNLFLIFTMFFSGGLIPTFLVMRDIGLYNNPLVMVLTGVVSVWNLMLARTYIQTSIPEELYEAAVLDGASHLTYFFRIVFPLSGTIIAVLCVYYGVGKWNDYFTGLVYITDRSWLPLQTILREILATLKFDASSMLESGADISTVNDAIRIAQVAKYCIIVVSTAPVIFLYLCMQKYFVKGVMVGSLKG